METTQQDIAYWRLRAGVEQEAAARAEDPRVKGAHENMAMRYRELLGLVSKESQAA